jgi:hypothetical protein
MPGTRPGMTTFFQKKEQSQSWPAGLARVLLPGGSSDATAERRGQLCAVHASQAASAGHDKGKFFRDIGRHAG